MARIPRRRTTIERLLEGSTWLNGLLIPVASVERTLARYTQPLVALNDGEDFPVSLVGSCVTVRCRERYIVLCTRHQLREWQQDLERIALFRMDTQNVITSGGVRHFVEGINETDFHDLVAFDFTEPYLEGAIPQECFFNLANLPPDVQSDHVVCLVCSGYPSADQNYDVQGARHIGLTKRIVAAELDGPDQPGDDALLRIRPFEQLDFDPDGMSGGPVFVIQIMDREPHAYFAGIMTRAGRDHIHIVRAGFVRQFVDLWLDS